jgi:hypothetical protein
MTKSKRKETKKENRKQTTIGYRRNNFKKIKEKVNKEKEKKKREQYVKVYIH